MTYNEVINKRGPNMVSSSWVPCVVYNGLRGQVTDLKTDLIAPIIRTYSHSSEVRIPR